MVKAEKRTKDATSLFWKAFLLLQVQKGANFGPKPRHLFGIGRMKQKRPNLLRTAANQRWVRIRLKSKPSGEEPQNNVSTTSANQAAINSPTKSSRTSRDLERYFSDKYQSRSTFIFSFWREQEEIKLCHHHPLHLRFSP